MAGHLGLGNLIVAYDDNGISIDGPTSLSFSEDVPQRYTAYGWHVLARRRRQRSGRARPGITRRRERKYLEPSLIAVRTHIGYGSPNKQDTAASHGSPLGKDEIQLTKEALGWPTEPTFHIPDETREAFRPEPNEAPLRRREWQAMFERYQEAHPDLADELQQRLAGELPAEWDDSSADLHPRGWFHGDA